MRVLIAPDKFKGTLSAADAAKAIARGWRKSRPRDRLELLPMSDGGDGFGAVLGGLMKARSLVTQVTDAAGRPRRARWWWVERRRIAIIEAAQSNGLALLPQGEFHPFDLDTTGVGALIRSALRKGARECIIGVGGSATNDGGFGLARSLGWRFLDRDGSSIEHWTELDRLDRIERPTVPLPQCRFLVATDVANPLLGPRGASRVYGPQKGLGTSDLPKAERALRRLGTVAERQLGQNPQEPGSGAAGGLGFGVRAFLNGSRELGFDLFARLSRLDQHLRRAGLVITGEGAFDDQSLMGKGVGQLLNLAKARSCPAVILAGRLEAKPPRASGIQIARGLCDLVSPESAMTDTARSLAEMAAGVARQIQER